MAFVDPYFDENVGDLRNLLGATSPKELKEREPQIVFANELEIESVGIPRTNNFAELVLIHGQLFKGVYDWAGSIRTVDIKKNADDTEFFLIVSKIATAAGFVFAELAKEHHLLGLSKGDFVKSLSHHYDQLNYIHPFREGNGRAQRVFWGRVAKDAAYQIDWDRIVDNENDEASRIAAEQMDLSKLEAMLARIVRAI